MRKNAISRNVEGKADLRRFRSIAFAAVRHKQANTIDEMK
jgi:hypothetical protein